MRLHPTCSARHIKTQTDPTVCQACGQPILLPEEEV